MNAPDRFELFVLPEGAKKVNVQKDTKIPDAASFTIEREDHTLGNIIRMQLLRDPSVLFAGYKVPHPLEHNIVVKVQTRKGSTPMEAMQTALNDLISEVGLLEERFKAEYRRVSENMT
eukprot:tig00000704_g3336.t1